MGEGFGAGVDRDMQNISIVREDRIMKRVFLSPAVIILLALSIFPLIW